MTPQRTCIGCGRVGAPGPLARIVVTSQRGVTWSRASVGRGAWLCADSPDCIAKAVKRKAFSRALHTEIVGDPQEQLRKASAGCEKLEGRIYQG